MEIINDDMIIINDDYDDGYRPVSEYSKGYKEGYLKALLYIKEVIEEEIEIISFQEYIEILKVKDNIDIELKDKYYFLNDLERYIQKYKVLPFNIDLVEKFKRYY